MDASWVAAIASVASAFVVGIAATAALLQIRHVRNANDIAIYFHLIDRLESANAMATFQEYEDFARRLEIDDALRRRMTEGRPVPEFQEIERFLRFVDNLAILAIRGSVTEQLVLTKYADDIVRLWDALAEAIFLRRQGIGTRFAATYEHLAMRAKSDLASGKVDRFYDRLLRDQRNIRTRKSETAL